MKLDKRKKINIKKIERIVNKKNSNYNFFLFIMGMVFTSIAISLFFNPNNIVVGGVVGLSMIINTYLNADLSLLTLVISSLLLILSFLLFGSKYSLKYTYGTFLFPIFVKASTLLVNVIDLRNTSLFLLVMCGAILSGLGLGLVKKSGYSLGGFGVIYDLLYEKFKISIGTANLICNFIVAVLSIYTFGIYSCIYAIIGLYISSYISDRVVLGISRNKAFYIVTKKSNEVKEYLINNLNHTVTVINAKGGYSDRKKEMLLCVIPTVEYIKIKEIIKEIDKDVFFLITDSYSISK